MVAWNGPPRKRACGDPQALLWGRRRAGRWLRICRERGLKVNLAAVQAAIGRLAPRAYRPPARTSLSASV